MKKIEIIVYPDNPNVMYVISEAGITQFESYCGIPNSMINTIEEELGVKPE